MQKVDSCIHFLKVACYFSRNNSGLVCENLKKEAVGGVISGLVGLHVNCVLEGKLFAVSRN